MASTLFAIFIFLLTIFIVAGIHELGHFLLARIFGVKVQKFSIGFGKQLCRMVDKRGTEYLLSLIPIGGYVKLLDTREGPVTADELPYAFDKRPLYQRFLVLVAGPLFNFLLAALAFWIIFIHGVVFIKPVVGDVIPNSIAARAGLQPQDEIIAIDGRTTLSWTSVAMALARHYGENKDLLVNIRSFTTQQAKKYTLNITKSSWRLDNLRPDLITSIGIKPYVPKDLVKNKEGKLVWPPSMMQSTHYNVVSALAKAVDETVYFISFNSIILYKMVTGVISWHGLSGPIGIFNAAASAAHYGVIIYLNFLALISISIGLLNLLPIPGLDGGQIVYLVYELIRGKPMSVSAQILAFRLGVILLIIIMLQALANDIMRLVP